jgi:ribonuclease T2
MIRRTRPFLSLAAASLAAASLAACLCFAGNAWARHRSHASDATPGEFAYYLLSLSWSPAYCLSSPGGAECNGPRRFGFIVHGLWPQNERGWPEYCDVRGAVPEEVARGISDLMPARGLVDHEWSAHGTCTGLSPAEFFALVRRAASSVAIPRELENPTRATEEPPAAIAAAFQHVNPRIPAQSIVVTCSGQSVPRLREVRVCLDRDLVPRACSADAIRGACRAAQVIVPPIR